MFDTLKDTVHVNCHNQIFAITVSTFINDDGDGNYDTMLFDANKKVDFKYSEQHLTREDAERRHKEIVEILGTTKYRLIPTGYKVVFTK